MWVEGSSGIRMNSNYRHHTYDVVASIEQHTVVYFTSMSFIVRVYSGKSPATGDIARNVQK